MGDSACQHQGTARGAAPAALHAAAAQAGHRLHSAQRAVPGAAVAAGGAGDAAAAAASAWRNNAAASAATTAGSWAPHRQLCCWPRPAGRWCGSACRSARPLLWQQPAAHVPGAGAAARRIGRARGARAGWHPAAGQPSHAAPAVEAFQQRNSRASSAEQSPWPPKATGSRSAVLLSPVKIISSTRSSVPL